MAYTTRKHVPPSDRPDVKRARNQRNYQERKRRESRLPPSLTSAAEESAARICADSLTTSATPEVGVNPEVSEMETSPVRPSERLRIDPDDFGGTWYPV